MRILALVLALILLPAQALAAARLVENEGKIFLKSGFLTQIWFSQPLVVRNILSGDSTKLLIEVVDNVIYVKPTASVINTDLVIITNNERYHLYLTTSEQYDPDVVLPAAAPLAKEEKRVDLDSHTYAYICNFDYRGDPHLRPAAVYRLRRDNVKKTIIELNPDFPEIPSITAKILNKDVAVNVRYKKHFLIVDNDIFDSFSVFWNGVKGEIKIIR